MLGSLERPCPERDPPMISNQFEPDLGVGQKAQPSTNVQQNRYLALARVPCSLNPLWNDRIEARVSHKCEWQRHLSECDSYR